MMDYSLENMALIRELLSWAKKVTEAGGGKIAFAKKRKEKKDDSRTVLAER